MANIKNKGANTFMNDNNINNGKKLNLKWVSEVIGEDYKTWNKGDIVKIQAQTGTGKTFFITGNKTHTGLVDYALAKNEQVLYLCNRANLKKQIKLDLLRKYDIEIPYIKDAKGNIQLDEKKRPQVDESELDKLQTIKNITIKSYHSIQNKKLESEYYFQEFNLDEYQWIIADECHFVLSDVSFVGLVRYTFEALFKEHNRHRRTIFISATMDWIEPYINEICNRIKLGINLKPKLHSYTTGIDYSYVNTKYFKYDDDIITTINNSINETNDKWLVFVANLRTAKELEKKIKDSKIVTANESDKKTKSNIIQHAQFECRVVIATKAIDNGVNFADENLRNIVIYAWDKITFIQELGRKRVNINNAQEINLYIKHRYAKAFKYKVNDIVKKENMLQLYKDDPITFNKEYENFYHKLPQELFYIDSYVEDKHNTAFKINNLAVINLELMKEEFEQIINEFKKNKEHAFVIKQLIWLGLETTFNETNYIENVASNEEVNMLRKFLDSVIGQRLYADEQQLLSDLIIKELTTIESGADYRTKKLKPNTLEILLREQLELPYAVSKVKREDKVIDGLRTTKSYIIISKIK
jgi:superfamily II DNA/RNA helicase